jgi:hypothetical protein
MFLLFVVTTCLCGWALWIRRRTWQIAWERSITLMAALSCATLVLILPDVSAPINVFLHAVTGRWNLTTYGGHMLGIGSASVAVYNGLRGLRNKQWLQRSFRRAVIYPSRAVMPMLLVLFWYSGVTRAPAHDVMSFRCGPCMRCYWTLLCSFYIYLLLYAARAYITLRYRVDRAPIMKTYLFAVCTGIVACVVRIATAWWTLPSGVTVLWVLACVCLGSYAVGAGYGWILRLRWFTEAIPSSGTKARPSHPQPL